MTREEAHTLLEIMAINLTGAIANSEDSVTEQTKLMAKQIEAIDMAIEALHQKGAYEQTKWERDVALQTLEEHGIGLGQKVEYIIPSSDVMFTSEAVRCKDCKWYQGVHGVQGHAPCEYFNKQVLWNDYCSNGELYKVKGATK